MKPDAIARHRRWLAVFLALFALSQAALWLAYYGAGAKALVGDEQSYQATALSILAGGRWMPGTIWPPLQPLWLALLYALFGVHVWVGIRPTALAQTGNAEFDDEPRYRYLYHDFNGYASALLVT